MPHPSTGGLPPAKVNWGDKDAGLPAYLKRIKTSLDQDANEMLVGYRGGYSRLIIGTLAVLVASTPLAEGTSMSVLGLMQLVVGVRRGGTNHRSNVGVAELSRLGVYQDPRNGKKYPAVATMIAGVNVYGLLSPRSSGLLPTWGLKLNEDGLYVPSTEQLLTGISPEVVRELKIPAVDR